MLKRIEIRNFKRVTEKPMILNDLSQVNYLVGKNGSGKSSVFDFLRVVYYEFVKLRGSESAKEQSNCAETVLVNMAPEFILNTEGEIIANNLICAGESLEVQFTKLKNENISYKITGKKPKNIPDAITVTIPKPLVFEFDSDLSYDMKYPNFYGNLYSVIKKQSGYDQMLGKNEFKKCILELIRYYQKSGSFKSSDFNAIFKPDPHDLNIYNQDSPVLPTIINTIDPFIFNLFELSYENTVSYSLRASGINSVNLLYAVIAELIKTPNVSNLYTICLEEPENRLHPNFQKKLPKVFQELINVGKKYGKEVQFIISTHSNYLISAALEQNQELGEDFNSAYLLEDGQNTQPDGGPIDFSHFDNTLSNLGVQPSDLLFANGVIWVEGHTDVLVISSLLDIIQRDRPKKYKEGLDFSFQVLATAIWKYASCWSINDIREADNDKIVNLFQISRKNLIIIDGDCNFEGDLKPSQYSDFSDGNGTNKAKLIHSYLKISKFNEDNLIEPYNGIYKDDEENKLLAYWVNNSTLEDLFNDLKPDLKLKITTLEEFNNLKNQIKELKTKISLSANDTEKASLRKERKNHQNSLTKMKTDLSKEFLIALNGYPLAEFNDLFEDNANSRTLKIYLEALCNTIKSWNQN